MHLMLLTALLAAMFVCNCALPVHEAAVHSDESLLHDNYDNEEQLKMELQEATEVEAELANSSSSNDNSESNESNSNEKRFVKHEDSELSDDQSDKTLLLRSSNLYDESFIAAKGNQYDVISDIHSNERTVRHVPEKKLSKSSSSSSEEEDNVLQESKVHLKQNLRERRSASDGSRGSSEEKQHKHGKHLQKRDASSKQSSEESAENKENKKADDSSSEEHGDKKQEATKTETAASRKRRQAVLANSIELKSAEVQEDNQSDETPEEDVQKADNVQLEVENSDEIAKDNDVQAKSAEQLKQNILNSVEDYVQGCEVMEPDSNEANETTYITDKR